MSTFNTPVVTNYTTTAASQTVAALFGTAGVALASTASTDYVKLQNARSVKFGIEYKVGAGTWVTLPVGKSVDLDIDLSATAVMLRLEVGAVEALVLDYSIATKPAGLATSAGEAITGAGGSTAVVNDLTSGGTASALSAQQGVVLNAADVASGAVAGNNLTLTLKGGSTVVIDVTTLAADVKVVSGSYNGTTKAIDFVCDPTSANFSVPVSALLPVTLDATSSLEGNGSTTGLKLSGDAAAPGNSKLYGTDGAGAKGWYAIPAATDLGVTPAASTVAVTSSSGTDIVLPAATTALAGVMTGADKTNLGALVSLSGMVAGSADLGTFTGTLIPDAANNKTALQALETAAEGAVAKATVTTKGDILAATGSAVVARVAVGADGQALVADTASAAGVKWAVMPDFWRSGAGATTLPDGATDLTEDIRRNGNIGVNADPLSSLDVAGSVGTGPSPALRRLLTRRLPPMPPSSSRWLGCKP